MQSGNMAHGNEKDRTLEFSPTITPELQTKILQHASNGDSIQTIENHCDISWSTIARYIIRDPLFAEKWESARMLGADRVADSLSHMYDHAETIADAMIGRGKSDNIRTLVAWRNPNRYNPKLEIGVKHSVDLTKALQQAEGRTIPILEQAQIERGSKELPDSLSQVPNTQSYQHVDRAVDKPGLFDDEREQLMAMARARAVKDNKVLSGELIEAEIVEESKDSSDDLDQYL